MTSSPCVYCGRLTECFVLSSADKGKPLGTYEPCCVKCWGWENDRAHKAAERKKAKGVRN